MFVLASQRQTPSQIVDIDQSDGDVNITLDGDQVAWFGPRDAMPTLTVSKAELRTKGIDLNIIDD